jgi:WD40 repeat protein/tRNA A-37 threonylcarbamoyl transferase component Bud32
MAIDSTAGLIDALRQGRFLPAAYLEKLPNLQARHASPRSLAKELLERGWLTAYQVNQIFQGQGSHLVLGQYLLLERLGEGGMGQVFKARHQRLERTVALKVIRKDRLTNPDAIERFQREARAAARLSHPNIVTVYDADEVGGTHFFAMEYVEGTDLSKLVKGSGPLPIAQACDSIRQAALGLQHAHEHGLVHRDIKPANLFLTAKGVVKILDMGLARLDEPGGAADHTTEPMTHTGAIMGTPDYLAPEQAIDCHRADIRADLYSLGCALYYLLTGKVPFPGGSLGEKLAKQLSQEPRRVDNLRSEIPPGVSLIVAKLMAKRPEDRFQTPAEVAFALTPFCSAQMSSSGTLTAPVAIPVRGKEPAQTVTYAKLPEAEMNTLGTGMTVGPGIPDRTFPLATLAPPPRQRWWRLATAAGVLLVVVLGVLWLFRSGSKGPGGADKEKLTRSLGELDLEPWPEVRQYGDFQWPPKGLVRVLGQPRSRHWGPVGRVALSPDGKWAASGGEDGLIWIWDTRTMDPKFPLPGHTKAVLSLAFSANSSQLLSGGADGMVRLWDVKTGRQLHPFKGHNDPITCVAISADGKRALSGAGGPFDFSVRLWDLTAKGTRAFRSFTGHKGGVSAVAFTPEGYPVSGGKDGSIRIWNTKTGNLLRERPLSINAKTVVRAISPNGRRALKNDFDHATVQLFNVETGKPASQPFAFGRPIVFSALGGDSQRCLVVTDRQTVLLWDMENGKELRRFENPGPVSCGAISRDGNQVLTGGVDGTVRLWDVKNGKQMIPLKGHAGAANRVVLFKDGRRALTSGADGNLLLWNLEKGKVIRTFPGPKGPIYGLALSPDERQALSGGEDGSARLWDVDTGKEKDRREFKPGQIWGVAFSPDGKLSYAAGENGYVFEWDWKDIKAQRSFETKSGPAFSIGISPKGGQALWGSQQGKLGLLDLKGWKEIRQYGSVTSLYPVAFSPNGDRGLAGSGDGGVRLWELKKDALQQPRVFIGLQKAVTSVAYAPKGDMVAASGVDGRVFVWKAQTREVLWKWKLPGAVFCVTFAADNRHLAIAGSNGLVYILRLDKK